eukprot:3225706-Prymnesium_polylepis.1
MPPRVRSAVGGGALAREARLLCGHADRHGRRDELDLDWGGRAVRVAALVGEQTRWHDAGWWGAAGRTVGDRHPRLWCARGTSAFSSFSPIVRAA